MVETLTVTGVAVAVAEQALLAVTVLVARAVALQEAVRRGRLVA
jgi:hypothetical protein